MRARFICFSYMSTFVLFLEQKSLGLVKTGLQTLFDWCKRTHSLQYILCVQRDATNRRPLLSVC